MTLPGIAGLALTIGMGVDANVLINERIREELRGGKSPRAAVEVGYNQAFSADPRRPRHDASSPASSSRSTAPGRSRASRSR